MPARFRLAGCSEAAPANPCNVEIVIAAATAELPLVVSTRVVSLMVAPATLAMPTPTPTATPSGPGPSPAPDSAARRSSRRTDGSRRTGAGDVNGDGYDDLLVGAERYDNGQVDEGRVYLFYGSATGLSPTPNWSAESDVAGASSAQRTTAGDVNGDGYADVIIGARRVHQRRGQRGSSLPLFWLACRVGRRRRPGRGRATRAAPSSARRWVRPAMSTATGMLMSSSVPLYDSSGQVGEGKAFVFYGSPAGLAARPIGSAESDQADAEFGM